MILLPIKYYTISPSIADDSNDGRNLVKFSEAQLRNDEDTEITREDEYGWSQTFEEEKIWYV